MDHANAFGINIPVTLIWQGCKQQDSKPQTTAWIHSRVKKDGQSTPAQITFEQFASEAGEEGSLRHDHKVYLRVESPFPKPIRWEDGHTQQENPGVEAGKSQPHFGPLYMWLVEKPLYFGVGAVALVEGLLSDGLSYAHLLLAFVMSPA